MGGSHILSLRGQNAAESVILYLQQNPLFDEQQLVVLNFQTVG